MEFYPDAWGEIPKDFPPEKGPRVRVTIYVDVIAHALVTRRSITGILVMLNNTPIRWISKKRQKTVETSNYGSELFASRIAMELILEVRYMLRSLWVALDGPELILGDNKYVSCLEYYSSFKCFEKEASCNCISPCKRGYWSKDNEVIMYEERRKCQ
jgi:hypothetical protein